MASHNESKGEEGEIQVGLALCRLDRATYHAFHNLTLKGRDGTAQIDHVLISRHGIFVLETKNYRGWIYGKEFEAQWTQKRSDGSARSFQNPLRQNRRHIQVLAELLELPEDRFHSLVVFCGESSFKTSMPENVLDQGCDGYILHKQALLLTETQTARAESRLRELLLPRTEETKALHLASLRERREAMLRRWRSRRDPPSPRDGAAEPDPEALLRRRSAGHRARKFYAAAALLALALLLQFWFWNRPGQTQAAAPIPNLPAPLPPLDPRPARTPEPEAPAEAEAPVAPPPAPKAIRPLPREWPEPEDPKATIRRMEEAWRRWYQRPAQCEGPNPNVVECGNHYILARREFERRYEAGELK